MPAVTSGKVLVTGATGYTAIWIVKNLLEQGYSVRATVRNEEKVTRLHESFPSSDKLEVVIVDDISVPGSLDEAVKGVDAIEHVADPARYRGTEPAEVIDPAVNGPKSVLESALKHGSAVKRIVFTGSAGAVLTASDEPRTFSEADWNEAVLVEIKEKGAEASALAKYRAAKTLAEKAIWAFYEEHKATAGFDVVVLNVPFVFGPLLHAKEAPENLDENMGKMFKNITNPEKLRDQVSLWKTGNCWVDVRDSATAHVVALAKEEAGGERIIVSASTFQWEDWASAGRSLRSGEPAVETSGQVDVISYDTSKAARILGITYRNKFDSIKDMLADFKAKGWLSA